MSTKPNVYDRIRARVTPETRQRVKDQMIELTNAAHPVYIGVDPAFRQGGFWVAVVDMTDKTVRFMCFESVLSFHDWLRGPDSPPRAFVCVENSNLQNQNFDTSGSKLEVARKGRNVGCNQCVSQLAYDSAVGRYGPQYVYEVSPKQKGAKYTPAQFAAVVRQDGVTLPNWQTNQDQRDAYKLAFIAKQRALLGGAFKTQKLCK